MRVPIPTIDDTALVWRKIRVTSREVAFVRALLEASDGLGCMFAERGGDVMLVTPSSQARRLDELIDDMRVDLGAIVTDRCGEPPDDRVIDRAQSRIEKAWRAWLEALARDALAALGAAFAYKTLDERGRDAVLDVLEVDTKHLSVPRVAVFAPLLLVENDPARRERIRVAMGDDVGSDVIVPARAYMGTTADGDWIVVAETHMYLGFVRVTTCRLTPDKCVRWVRSDPINEAHDVTAAGLVVEGAELDEVPMQVAVDSVARAIVAQRRLDGCLPASLRPLVELFDAG